MNNRNIFVRIVAILLCAVIILGVVTAALSAFATDAAVLSAPDTGSQSMIWVVVAVVAALGAIVACLVIPKIKK